jgi:hypothetical protein
MDKDKERVWFKRWMYALVAFAFCMIVSQFNIPIGNPAILVKIIVMASGVYSLTIGIIYIVHRRRKWIKYLENEFNN